LVFFNLHFLVTNFEHLLFIFVGIFQASRDLYEVLVEEEAVRGRGVVEAVVERTR